MYTNRINYWSNSKLADLIRTKVFKIEPKPKYATMDEWQEYKENAAKRSRFGVWLTEDLFDGVQDAIYYPMDVLNSIRLKFLARFSEKTFMVKTGLDKWSYHDPLTVLLHANMQIVVDFIEIEKAHLYHIFSKDENTPFRYKNKLFRWFMKRDAEAGLKYLKWEMNINDHDCFDADHQRNAAKELFEIYNWWKFDFPNRVDPYMLSWVPNNLEPGYNHESYVRDSHYWYQINEIEELYHWEEQYMLERLIKIRNHLWT